MWCDSPLFFSYTAFAVCVLLVVAAVAGWWRCKVLRQQLKQLNDDYQHVAGLYENYRAQENEFIADASHELRTPLAGIRLQTQIAMRSEKMDQVEKAHNNILTAADRATRLVEQLLALSRLNAENEKSAFAHIDWRACCQSVITTLQNPIDSKAITVVLRDIPDNLCVFAKKDSMVVLLENVLFNAIQCSPTGASIYLRATQTDQITTVSVVDEGPGIARQDRERVLRRFQKSRIGAKAGAGLGLAIARRVVDQHNGQLLLDSGPGNRGLSVVIVLPNAPEIMSRGHVK